MCFNLKNTKEKQKKDIESKLSTVTSTEVYGCSIPVCMYSADKLNENINSKPKAIALFSTSAVSLIFIIY